MRWRPFGNSKLNSSVSYELHARAEVVGFRTELLLGFRHVSARAWKGSLASGPRKWRGGCCSRCESSSQAQGRSCRQSLLSMYPVPMLGLLLIPGGLTDAEDTR